MSAWREGAGSGRCSDAAKRATGLVDRQDTRGERGSDAVVEPRAQDGGALRFGPLGEQHAVVELVNGDRRHEHLARRHLGRPVGDPRARLALSHLAELNGSGAGQMRAVFGDLERAPPAQNDIDGTDLTLPNRR